MAPLDRAVTLAQMDANPVAVPEHLDLDVARLLHELLEVEHRRAEGRLGLRLAVA